MKTIATVAILCLALLLSGCAGMQQELKTAYPSFDLWTGEWKSEKFSRACGQISAMIPQNLENGANVDVPVVISFSILSPYYAGETLVADFKGSVENDTVTAEYNPHTKIDPRILNLSFSNGRSRNREKITLFLNDKKNKAQGVWTSNDGEEGFFSLAKVPTDHTKP